MQEELVNMPRTQRGRATLNNILSAAAQVIYEKGYHAASINDITSLAGVASGTFYVYFDGKYNLYKYLLLQCSRKIRKYLSRSIQGCKTRLEAERVGMKAWLEFTLENQYMYHIIWESMYIDYNLFKEYYVTFCAAYKEGLDKAKAAGEIQEDKTVKGTLEDRFFMNCGVACSLLKNKLNLKLGVGNILASDVRGVSRSNDGMYMRFRNSYSPLSVTLGLSYSFGKDIRVKQKKHNNSDIERRF